MMEEKRTNASPALAGEDVPEGDRSGNERRELTDSLAPKESLAAPSLNPSPAKAGEGLSALTLPYAFDTRSHGRIVMRIITILDVILTITAVEMAFWAKAALWKVWVPSVLVIVIVALFALGLYAFRAAGGASGTVGKQDVIIDPDKMYGLRTRTHFGSFPTKEFAGLALVRVGPSKNMGVLHIVNKNPLLRIVLTFDRYEKVKADADFLAKELSLPLHEAG